MDGSKAERVSEARRRRADDRMVAAPRLVPTFSLGDVFEDAEGGRWLVTGRHWDERVPDQDVYVAALVPAGEQPEGFGRTWTGQQTSERVVFVNAPGWSRLP